MVLLDQECIHSLVEALSTSSTWPKNMVSVVKRVSKASVEGICVEQSDLTVTTTGEEHAPTQWRSVCLESKALFKIEKLLGKEVKKGVTLGDHLRGIADSVVQGYPAFILARSCDYT